MDIDEPVYQMHLAVARRERGLNLAVFDESKHPRLHGRFSKSHTLSTKGFATGKEYSVTLPKGEFRGSYRSKSNLGHGVEIRQGTSQHTFTKSEKTGTWSLHGSQEYGNTTMAASGSKVDPVKHKELHDTLESLLPKEAKGDGRSQSLIDAAEKHGFSHDGTVHMDGGRDGQRYASLQIDNHSPFGHTIDYKGGEGSHYQYGYLHHDKTTGMHEVSLHRRDGSAIARVKHANLDEALKNGRARRDTYIKNNNKKLKQKGLSEQQFQHFREH